MPVEPKPKPVEEIKVEPEKPKSQINDLLSIAIHNVDFSSKELSQQLNGLSEITNTARTDDQAIQVKKNFDSFCKI